MTTKTKTTAIAKQTPTAILHEYLHRRTKVLGEWCKGGIDPRSLERFALADFQKSPKLQLCSPQPIYLALVACAQVGLEPGGVMQHCFIIPYNCKQADKKTWGYEARFQLGYRGVFELANRSPLIARVGANLVYEAELDKLDIDLGSDAHVIHRPAFRDRGAIVGAYAYAKFTNGEFDAEWTGMDDLLKIRKAGAEGPAWQTWADQMYRKAPVKRIGKRLPLTPEAAWAFRLDSQAEGGDHAAYIETLEESGVVIEHDDSNGPARSGTEKLKAELK